MDLISLFYASKPDNNRVTFEATVTTGFEFVAASEIQDTLGNHIDVFKSRGRVFFNAPISSVSKILSLRAIDNLYGITYALKSQELLSKTKEEAVITLKTISTAVDWCKSVSVWKEVTKFQGICFPCRSKYNHALEEEAAIKDEIQKQRERNHENMELCEDLSQDDLCYIKNTLCGNFDKSNTSNKSQIRKLYQEKDMRSPKEKVLKFRVTCNRSGQHAFTSIEGAWYFGGQLQDHYNWIVDLVNYDLEVVLNVKDDIVYVGVALTEESLHKRNIMYFGPTTLRATICYNLLRLAEPKSGDVVLDPLCGGGSISIEGAVSFPATYQLCGDIHSKAVNRTLGNFQYLINKKKCNMDVAMWDVCYLPLQDASIDVLVTDLPFGKRSGSKFNNDVLYKRALLEVARAMRSSGRAVCLTWDKKNLMRTIYHLHDLWTLNRIIGVNIGGLAAAAYVLKRTCQTIFTYLEKNNKPRKKRKKKQ